MSGRGRPRTICVVTGTRADYGLLRWVMREIADDPALELRTVATGAHLSSEFGDTVAQIVDDGFAVDERVDMLLSDDGPVAVTKSTGLAVIGFADAFRRLAPDIVMLLGDRYEMLAAAQAALFARLPIAHIAGGDLTEGALDDSVRHAITKMAHIHFATNEPAAGRIRQLGENPALVHTVGSPGLDNLRRINLPDREALERALGFTLRRRNLIVTYHPETAESDAPAEKFRSVVAALDRLDRETGIIVTGSNADADGRRLTAMGVEFAAARDHVIAVTTLGTESYLGALSHVDAVVGNSSSGLYEAPSFGIPTVNIGSRQDGRLRASSVIDCGNDTDEIVAAIERALTMDCSGTVNPYGDGHAAPRIVRILKDIADPGALVKKRFYPLAEAAE